MTTTRRAMALALVVLAPLAAVWAVPPAADADAFGSSLTLVSTPNDPMVGGRTFRMGQQVSDNASVDHLGLTFRRTDQQGAPLSFDPEWFVSIASVGSMSPGDTYPLGGTSDVLRLADAYRFMSSRCPDLTGSVTVTQVSVATDGLPTSFAGSFTMHCTPDDAVYGAVAFNAPAPALPDGAASVEAADATYPKVAAYSPTAPDSMLAVRLGDNRVDLRWDGPGGFTCAEVFAADSVTNTTRRLYFGRDDTVTVDDLDPTHTINLQVSLYQEDLSAGVGVCGASYLGSASLGVFPVAVSVVPLTPTVPGGASTIRGTVGFTNDTEPDVNAKVVVTGLSANQPPVSLGTARTDDLGRFSLTVTAPSSLTVVATVPAGRSGWASNVHHFGATSAPVDLLVRHLVRARLDDASVARGHSAHIHGRLVPGEPGATVLLERRTAGGAWRVVDTADPDQSGDFVVTLPSARTGWQVLRVRAPADADHARGVSDRLRLLGY
ncbi:MAG: hypothetical protein WAN48_03795 [Actinomycetes bacterium]